MSFVARHGLWSAEQKDAASRLRRIVEEHKLEVDPAVVSRPARHPARQDAGRGRSAGLAGERLSHHDHHAAKDTSHRTVFPVFTAGGGFGMREMEGAADVLMLADPTTFRVLPWAPTTGWMLCDIYFADGRPVPFATRHIYRAVLEQLGAARLRLHGRPRSRVPHLQARRSRDGAGGCRPARRAAGGQPADAGYQYLTEQRYDQMEPVLEIMRRNIVALGLPLALGRGRVRAEPVRVHLRADAGLEPADTMVLFRSAVKQIAQRHGYHATFMCRPGCPT